LKSAVPVIGPIEVIRAYVANEALLSSSISTASSKPTAGTDWLEKTSIALVKVTGAPPFTLTVAVPKLKKRVGPPVTLVVSLSIVSTMLAPVTSEPTRHCKPAES
jgi:hypothetical protein